MSDVPPAGELPLDRPPIRITYHPKPRGTPGRKAPRGYDLQAILDMIREHFMYTRHVTHIVLSSTRGIDMSKTIERQSSPGLITLVIQKILREIDEFEIFRHDGYWPIRAFIYIVLKSSTEKHKRLRKALALGGPSESQPGDESGPPSGNDNQPGAGTGQTPANQPVENPANEPVAPAPAAPAPADPAPAPADPAPAPAPVAPAPAPPPASTPAPAPTTARSPIEVGIEVQVETATDYAPPTTATNDDVADDLVVGMSSMAIELPDNEVEDGDVSMHDASLGGSFLANLTNSSTHDSTAPPSMQQAWMSLSDSEIAALPPVLRQAFTALGATPAGGIPEQSNVQLPAPATTTTAPIPVPTVVPGAASTPAAAPEPTPAAKNKGKGKLPANAAPPTAAPTSTVEPTVTSNNPPLPVTGLFDDDGSLSDAPSATSSNNPTNLDTARRTTRSTSKGAQPAGRDNVASGSGRGAGKNTGGAKGDGAQGAGRVASTTAKGRGGGKAPAKVVDSDEQRPVASGTRRTRKT